MHFTCLVIGDNVEEQLAPFQENNNGSCPEEYIEKETDPSTGEEYYYNPNAQWDWWVIGGRWRGYWKLKEGRKGQLGEVGIGDNEPEYDADSAKKGDIDFNAMIGNKRHIAEHSWKEFMSPKNKYKRLTDKYFGSEYGVQNGESKQQFLKKMSSIKTYAVLINGKWLEELSEKGWQKLLNSVSDDTLLTIVDCHI